MKKKFGVEFEFVQNRSLTNKIRSILSNGEYSFSANNRESSKEWNYKRDYSCGNELTTPALFFSKENLFYVCKVIDEIKSYSKKLCRPIINKKCGLHVHLDVKKLKTESNWHNYFNVWKAVDKQLFYLLDLSRTNNKYCTEICNSDYIPLSKYYSVHRYRNKNRIEVRYAQSSIDSEFVYNWICLVYSISSIAEHIVSKKLQTPIINNKVKSPKNMIKFLRTYKNFIDQDFIDIESIIKWINSEYKKYKQKKEMKYYYL